MNVKAMQWDLFGNVSQIYIVKNNKEVVIKKEGFKNEIYSETKGFSVCAKQSNQGDRGADS